MLEVDVIVTHPSGVTAEMKQQMIDAMVTAAEKFGGEVGGSFEFANEPEDEKKEVNEKSGVH